MDKALLELIKISNAIGRDSSLVQGGGGNTSVKTDDGKYMYIKASGTALKDMNTKRGWRRMRLEPVLSIIKDKSLAKLEVHKRETEVVNRLLLACDDDVTCVARPSVEAHLHAFLDKCVIHLHPSSAGAFANAKNGKTELEKLFKKIENYLPLLWVPYTNPGFTLAKSIAKLVDDYQKRYGKKPAILFLEKHGLLISADSADTALHFVHRVINLCDSQLSHPKPGDGRRGTRDDINKAKRCIRKAFFEATGQKCGISYFYDDAIAAFLQRKDAKKLLSGVITPDELVYANGPAMWVEPRQRTDDRGQRAESRRQRNLTSDFRPFDCAHGKLLTSDVASRLTLQIKSGEKHSVAFLVKDVGLFIAGKKKIATTVRDIVAYSIFIRTNADRMGGILSLNKRQRDFINKWESEAFRMKMASS